MTICIMIESTLLVRFETLLLVAAKALERESVVFCSAETDAFNADISAALVSTDFWQEFKIPIRDINTINIVN